MSAAACDFWASRPFFAAMNASASPGFLIASGRFAVFEEIVEIAIRGESRIVFAIVQKPLCRHVTVEHTEQILSRYAVARLVKEDRQDGCTASNQGTQNRHFWDGIVGTAGVAAEPSGPGQGGEEDDRIAAQLNIKLQRSQLVRRQRVFLKVQLQRFKSTKVYRKTVNIHGTWIPRNWAA